MELHLDHRTLSDLDVAEILSSLNVFFVFLNTGYSFLLSGKLHHAFVSRSHHTLQLGTYETRGCRLTSLAFTQSFAYYLLES